jgi:hypothetical protein
MMLLMYYANGCPKKQETSCTFSHHNSNRRKKREQCVNITTDNKKLSNKNKTETFLVCKQNKKYITEGVYSLYVPNIFDSK